MQKQSEPGEMESPADAERAARRRSAQLLKHRAFLVAFAVIAAAGIALLPGLSPTTRNTAFGVAAVVFGVQIVRRWNG